MEIVFERQPKERLGDFARRNNLTLRVVELEPTIASQMLPYYRFYARFDGAEVKEGRILVSTSGRGVTEDAAIADYARRISGAHMVLNATSDVHRIEIRVPQLEWEGLPS